MSVKRRTPNSNLSAREKSRILTLKEGYNPTQIFHKTKIPRSIVFGFLIRYAKYNETVF
jgi:hypothetical protein